jgi:hypothetical protein
MYGQHKESREFQFQFHHPHGGAALFLVTALMHKFLYRLPCNQLVIHGNMDVRQSISLGGRFVVGRLEPADMPVRLCPRPLVL